MLDFLLFGGERGLAKRLSRCARPRWVFLCEESQTLLSDLAFEAKLVDVRSTLVLLTQMWARACFCSDR